MIKLYKCADLLEAQGILDYLTAKGINSKIFNEYSAGGMGEIPFTETGPEIWITDNSEFEKAQSLLKSYHQEQIARQKHSGELRPCPYCDAINPGNFNSCWSCQRVFPEQ